MLGLKYNALNIKMSVSKMLKYLKKALFLEDYLIVQI